jgi:hypothetical protein
MTQIYIPAQRLIYEDEQGRYEEAKTDRIVNSYSNNSRKILYCSERKKIR